MWREIPGKRGGDDSADNSGCSDVTGRLVEIGWDLGWNECVSVCECGAVSFAIAIRHAPLSLAIVRAAECDQVRALPRITSCDNVRVRVCVRATASPGLPKERGMQEGAPRSRLVRRVEWRRAPAKPYKGATLRFSRTSASCSTRVELCLAALHCGVQWRIAPPSPGRLAVRGCLCPLESGRHPHSFFSFFPITPGSRISASYVLARPIARVPTQSAPTAHVDFQNTRNRGNSKIDTGDKGRPARAGAWLLLG